MLTRFALVLSLSLVAAGTSDAAISRHEATGLVGERSEAVIEKKQVSPIEGPVIVEDIPLGTAADTAG